MRGGERRPMAAAAVRECCELGEHRSPRFRWAAEAVSAKESDRLVAIAHPNTAVGAAVDVLRCCGPGESYQAGFTKGGTAHLLVVSRCCLPPFSSERRSARTPLVNVSQVYYYYPPRGM
jgi:hypothetical protein